jgi:hypothetical protein
MTPNPDDVLREMAALRRYDVEPAMSETLRDAALARYRAVQGLRVTKGSNQKAGVFVRFVEPALLIGAVVGFLTWTATTLSSLYVH